MVNDYFHFRRALPESVWRSSEDNRTYLKEHRFDSNQEKMREIGEHYAVIYQSR